MWVYDKPVQSGHDITEKIINIEIVSTRSSKEISLIKTHIYGLIIDPPSDQLPVGLKAQLLEHCADIDLPQVDCEMRDETRKARDEVPSRATKSRNASDEVASRLVPPAEY